MSATVMGTTVATTDRLLATFCIDGTWFGLDATDVQEVMRPQPLSGVPLATDDVLGLVNLRGQIVVALDLRPRLGLARIDEFDEQMHVVVHSPYGAVSLMVDEIGDVIEAHAWSLEPAPATMPRHLRESVDTVLKLDGRLILVLDVAQATAPTRRTPISPDALLTGTVTTPATPADHPTRSTS